MSSIIAYLLSKPKSRVLRDGLAVIGLLYLLGRLRRLKLSNLIKAIPGAQGALDRTLTAEVTKAVAGQFPKELVAKGGIRIPENGFTASQLLDQMRTFQKFDADGHGRTFAYVYDTDMKEHSTLIEKAFTQFMHENALNPIAFPALRKFEVEVVQMTLSMLNAPLGACGTMTSGGTESILCALKAYRDRARDKYPGIENPEVVIPQTGHVAFPKGMHMFGLTPVWVPVGDDFRPDLKAYRAAINKNTVLLVASAPQYPHGVVDPISEISQLAEEFKLPLHVDACIGGFLLPWVEKLGYPVPTWDFRNAGVTSISADLHKYGYSAKGGSVLSWRYESDRKYQFYAFTEWPGGLFVSPSMLGTRAGGSIAAAWASLNGLGEKGFMKLSDKIMKTATKLKNGIKAIPGLKILGNPHMGILSIGSSNPELNILCVADVMEKDYEWHIERQQKPDCLHLTLMPPHSNTADQFLKDIALSVDKALKTPSLKEAGSAAMYGAVAKIPDNVLIENFLTMWMGQVYNPTAGGASDKKPESKQSE